MPSRNILKTDISDSFYHAYGRGTNKMLIFRDSTDYEYFVMLLKRYLDAEEMRNSYGVHYPNFYNKLELNAFCLMPNHFHLLLYQHQPGMMTQFMRSLLTSYSRYFNAKYSRRGPLFESRYKASLIQNQTYIEHISRYIHLNPRNWNDWPYSSLSYYLHQNTAVWIRPGRILQMFKNSQEYGKFIRNYREHKQVLELIKEELANR